MVCREGRTEMFGEEVVGWGIQVRIELEKDSAEGF